MAPQPQPGHAAEPAGPPRAASDGLRVAGGDQPQRARRGGGPGSWPAWMAPAALVSGLALAAVGGLVVDIPALALGAKLPSSHVPAGLEILATAVQDMAFVAAAQFFAPLGGGLLWAWQLGRGPPLVR